MTGPELREWRNHWHLSQMELASQLGVHLNTYNRWERGAAQIPPFLPLALETLARDLAMHFEKIARSAPVVHRGNVA